MKHIICFLLSLLFQHLSSAQAQIEWQKSLGGTDADVPYSIKQTFDQGYIIAGNSNSNNGDVTGNHGSSDAWILKIDENGTVQWQKSLGGTKDDWASSIQQTSDSGYIVAATSLSNDGNITWSHGKRDAWVVKLTTNGTIQWQLSLGGTEDDWANSIRQTSDGGYVVAGTTLSYNGGITGNHGGGDCWVVKLAANGVIQWQKTLGGTDYDYASSIRQTSDNGYIIAGATYSNDGNIMGYHGELDGWVVKIATDGAIQWQKTLGGTGYDLISSIQQTMDGGYIVAGISDSTNGDITINNGGNDAWVIKLDVNGTIQWQKSLGGTGYDSAYSIEQTSDGGYIFAGASSSNNGDVTGNHGNHDAWVVKLSNIGIIQWQKSLGGTQYECIYSACDIQQTLDNEYIVVGFSNSNNGDVTGSHGAGDYWVVKLSNTSMIQTPLFSIESIYPNPTNGTLYITLNELGDIKEQQVSLVSLLGQTLITQKISSTKFTFDISNQASGIYILCIQDKEGNAIHHKIEKL